MKKKINDPGIINEYAKTRLEESKKQHSSPCCIYIGNYFFKVHIPLIELFIDVCLDLHCKVCEYRK